MSHLRPVHEGRDRQAEVELLVALSEELLHRSARPCGGDRHGLCRVGDVGGVESHGEEEPHVLSRGHAAQKVSEGRGEG